ncbi:MAG: HAMP domain-containing protein [Pedosphaera sp.]|nr:HAMP domain-containing protein [Pedosphaera sp.]
MKPRFPLAAKILLWFFLNLLLLAAVSFLVLRVQFRFGLDLLISGRGGERIQGLANVIAAEIAERPREEWDEILNRFGKGYGVQLALFRPDGGLAVGADIELPREVNERLRERPNLPPQRGNNPGFVPPGEGAPASGPARPENDFPRQPERRPFNGAGNDFEPPRPRAGPEAGAPNDGRPDPPRNPPNAPLSRPRFMVRAGEPPRYWVGVPLPSLDPQRPQPRVTLLAISDSLRGGGLFFDFTPWLLAGGAVVALSVLFWLPLVRGITRAISQMTRATGEMAEGRFDARVSERRRDELGALAGAINRMAARLGGFVSGQKRFLGDTAHELCAPIARMQMALGILEQRADEKQKPYVNDVREELQHISALVNELLSFSKAGMREQPVALQSVVVAEIANRVAEREGKNGGAIEVNVAPELCALAEPELLSRALANLVRNALRYAGNAGPVRLSASREGEQILISVCDDGPGVPEEALQKIFDPFFRLEESRSRETGGVGLGLAIVKTCVEACGGAVTAHNRAPNGLEVRIVLRTG